MNPHPTCDAYPGQPEGANNFRCRLVILSVDQLCPHPSYTRHQLSVSASQLKAISAFGDLAFQQPIMVTQKGIVIDGNARWKLARQQGRESVLCPRTGRPPANRWWYRKPFREHLEMPSKFIRESVDRRELYACGLRSSSYGRHRWR